MSHLLRWTIGILVVVSSTGCGLLRPVSYETLLAEMVERDAIARVPDPYYTCHQASSYDRASTAVEQQNTWFANKDANQFIRTEENGGRKEWVLMDAAGPGAIVRFWSANPRDEVIVRFYLDGSTTPALTVPMTDLLGGTWRVGLPLSAIRSKGWNLYLPIPYARHCKVTTDKDNFYYQINYRTYEPGTAVRTFSMAEFDRAEPALRGVIQKLNAAGQAVALGEKPESQKEGRIAPNEGVSVPLPAGPAVVGSLMVALRAADLEEAYRRTVISITFDGEETVWCPVGDFFGSGLGVNPFSGWWQTVDKEGLMTCRWPMPYQGGGEIRLYNHGVQPVDYVINAQVRDWRWDARSMHFHATWRQEHPVSTEKKHDWNFVRIEGTGVYVGDSMALMNPTTVWWGEGDEKISVDGESFPSHFGTGTEDYYGYAWGDWHRFEAPFHAQPRIDGPAVLGHTTLWRTRTLDAIPFHSSLNFDMEIWHWRKVEMAVAATTWYYARPGATNNRVADRQPESLRVVPLTPVYAIPGALEAETMEIVSRPEGADWKQEGNWWNVTWSGDAQLWVGCTRVGDKVELRAPTTYRGPQQLTLYATRYPDYGIIQVSVDGKELGEKIDLCNIAEKAVKPTGPIVLGVFEPGAAPPVFRFEVVGSNPSATKPGTYVGIDCLVVEPAPPATAPEPQSGPRP